LEVQSVFTDFNHFVSLRDKVAFAELENLQVGRPVCTPKWHADQWCQRFLNSFFHLSLAP
jgi:hypothetical protein